MYKLNKLRIFDIPRLNIVAHILNACGKDMAQKHGLHHWDNPYIKSLVIVGMCVFKNDIFLLYDNEKPVATFQTRFVGDALHFEKLATLPDVSGKGIGSFCMHKIEEMAAKHGCKKVAMEVYEPSQHAIRFYEHKGFKAVAMNVTLKYKEVKMEKGI